MGEKSLAIPTERSLAKEAEEDQLTQIMERVATKAAKVVDGLFLEPDAKGYNADATAPWAEASTKTRAALAIVKSEMDRRGQSSGQAKVLGIVLLPGRAQSAAEWEREAIDVQVEVKK